ncbi:hypothetical protein DY000_02016878 [Brassica cretica]|uniref:Uncharacterized protein n=1 Tax=Brassica cretica TaxID=69181 RepID=A0ABQ7CPC5_BRACR|nr:hypothetical protein DY000_02016878 [Brassica cretica]
MRFAGPLVLTVTSFHQNLLGETEKHKSSLLGGVPFSHRRIRWALCSRSPYKLRSSGDSLVKERRVQFENDDNPAGTACYSSGLSSDGWDC